jgi:hypothetical protein
MLEGFGSELRRLRVKTQTGVVKYARRHWRKDLLLNLLNLEGTHCKPFWRSSLAPIREPDKDLLLLRDELREVFSRNERDNYIPETLNRWLRSKPVGSEPVSPFVLNWHWRILEESPAHLRVSLVRAVTELFGKVGCCENPDCRTYFIKLKKKYRFCDSPNCQAYGQRKYKREWWAEHGSARRAKKKSGKVCR